MPTQAPVWYREESAAEIVHNIRTGTCSAAVYAKALAQQAECWASLNAFITLNPGQLLADAQAIDQRIAAGEPVGPLAGLPIIIKDCIDTADYPTTSGTPSLKHYRPRRNAPVVQRLLDAGAIVAGKANMHELAYGITSNNFYMGPVRNPYDPALIPGGSSGGTAAAIAARVGVVGLGTDTGGSVRIPAALCGVAGLRTTLGRWPAAGMMPASHSRDVIGPLGRSVADLALLDSVVMGGEPVRAAKLNGLRLGLPTDPFWTHLDPETARIAQQALVTLSEAGIELLDVTLREIWELDQRHGFPIALFETLLDIPSYLLAGDTGVTYDSMIEQIISPMVKKVITQAPDVPLEVYTAALKARARMQALYAVCWERYGISGLVFPTTPMPARPIGQEDTVELNGEQVPTFPTYIRNTGPASVAALPGLSLPVGLTAAGLPVGLELDGPAWQDRELLSIGLAIEKLFPALKPPPLPA